MKNASPGCIPVTHKSYFIYRYNDLVNQKALNKLQKCGSTSFWKPLRDLYGAFAEVGA